jgi:osomolarity two-component system, sensor histidine kinase SLN1
MPNLDGLQSTRLIRQMGYSAPIVALTAFAEESNVQECMNSGMDMFLRYVPLCFYSNKSVPRN